MTRPRAARPTGRHRARRWRADAPARQQRPLDGARRRSSPPTTAARSSSRRRGRHDIPAYLFTGGLAAGSSLLAAGADLTGATALRRTGRLGALVALASAWPRWSTTWAGRRGSTTCCGSKPTSPMSVGTWILSAYGPFAGARRRRRARGLLPAGATRRLRGRCRLLPPAGRPGRARGRAHRAAGRDVHRGAARRHRDAVVARGLPRAAVRLRRLGRRGVRRARHDRRAGRRGRPGPRLAARRRARRAGDGAAAWSSRWASPPSRSTRARPGRSCGPPRRSPSPAPPAPCSPGAAAPLAVLSGAALLAGSACTRFGVFEAGQASARDPKYTVVPQRERLEREGPTRHAAQ